MKTKVSVIIPVFNSEKYLKKTLQSVENQTFQNFEAIVINDGSTDGSQKIIDEFCTKDSRFKCFDQSNLGVSAARNKGNSLAHGEFISYLDADDTLPENAVEKLYNAISDEHADIAVGITRIVDNGDGYTTRSTQRLGKKKVINRWDKDLISTGSVCNRMFKKSMIVDNNILFRDREEINAEDSIFNYNCYLFTKKITGCDSVVYNYIKRPHIQNYDPSLSQEISENEIDKRKRSYLEIAKCIDEMKQMDTEFLTDPDRGEVILQYEETRIANLKRYINTLLIEKAYSKGWILQDEILNKIHRNISEEIEALDDASRNVICKGSKYFNKNCSLVSMDEMSDNPIFSIILGPKVKEKQLAYLVNSIYKQEFPFFEIIMSEDTFRLLPDAIKKVKNIKIVDNTDERKKMLKKAYKSINGKYAMIIDDPVYFNRMTLKNVYKKCIKKRLFKECDYVELSLRNEEGCLREDKRDMISDKIFSYNAMKKKRIKFSNTCEEDMRIIRKKMKGMFVSDISLVYENDGKAEV